MRAFFIAVSLLLCACGAQPAASNADANTLHVADAWSPPTPGGVDVSAGYLTIVNGTSTDDTLLSATSPRAQRVELHEMAMDGSVMRMRAVTSLPVPAHGNVTLAPSGRHLMFFGVTQPFTPGESIPVTLHFEHAGDVQATLSVHAGGMQH